MRFLFAIALLVCAAFAAEVSFEGTLEADYGTFLEKDFVVNNAVNQDLRLKMNVDLDENARVVVGVASVGSYFSRDSSAQQYSYSRIYRNGATPIGSDERWSPFHFDGISFEWTVKRDLTFIFGDLFYSFGSFNYYYWRNADNYAAILTTQGLRGLGVRLGSDGYIYLGASDANDKAGRIAASYAIPILNQINHKFVINPMLDFSAGSKEGGRDHRYTVGLDANYSRSYTDFNYAVRAMYGLHPSHGDYVNTFTLEPSFNYKRFSLASTCYWALLSDDSSEEALPVTVDETYAPDKSLIYIEPSVSITKKFSIGVGGEWHNSGELEDWFLIAPTFYLYPTAGMDLSFWLGYAIKDGYNNPSFGISSSVVF